MHQMCLLEVGEIFQRSFARIGIFDVSRTPGLYLFGYTSGREEFPVSVTSNRAKIIHKCCRHVTCYGPIMLRVTALMCKLRFAQDEQCFLSHTYLQHALHISLNIKTSEINAAEWFVTSRQTRSSLSVRQMSLFRLLQVPRSSPSSSSLVYDVTDQSDTIAVLLVVCLASGGCLWVAIGVARGRCSCRQRQQVATGAGRQDDSKQQKQHTKNSSRCLDDQVFTSTSSRGKYMMNRDHVMSNFSYW